KQSGRGAAIVCLIVSVALHAALIAYVPQLRKMFSGSGDGQLTEAPSNDPVSVAVFQPDFDDDQSLAEQLAMPFEESGDEPSEYASEVTPLPLPEPLAVLAMPTITETKQTESLPEPQSELPPAMPASLASAKTQVDIDLTTDIDDVLGDWLTETLAPPETETRTKPASV
ncbi:unnamed protein product, partial [Hapterophycus canaliculatus]